MIIMKTLERLNLKGWKKYASLREGVAKLFL